MPKGPAPREIGGWWHGVRGLRAGALWRTGPGRLSADRLPRGAEDLVQDVLVRAGTRWPRITDRGHPEAYVRRMLVTQSIDTWRKWHREVPAGEATAYLLQSAAEPVAVPTRVDLARALARPRRPRAGRGDRRSGQWGRSRGLASPRDRCGGLIRPGDTRQLRPFPDDRPGGRTLVGRRHCPVHPGRPRPRHRPGRCAERSRSVRSAGWPTRARRAVCPRQW